MFIFLVHTHHDDDIRCTHMCSCVQECVAPKLEVQTQNISVIHAQSC